jgi:integrase
MPKKPAQPAYRLHKARKCAVVTIDGKNHYLGPWQSAESHAKYATLIAEWNRTHGVLLGPVDELKAKTLLTLNDLILAYFTFAQGLYVKRGKPTSEQGCLRQALRFVRKLYGTTLASEFGPRALKNVRQAMVDAGRARKSINRDVHRIRRMFRWSVEEELLHPETYQKLQCVTPLAKGNTTARETGKLPPIPIEHVMAILPHLPPVVAAMVQLQLLTGTRPQEIMELRPSDLTAGVGVWYYSPRFHKTEHMDREKCIVLGPKALEILRPYLERDPEEFCFKPAESVAWQRQKSRKKSKEPVVLTVAQSRPLNAHYTRHSYRLAVQRACRRASVPVPNSPRVRKSGSGQSGSRSHRHAGNRNVCRARSKNGGGSDEADRVIGKYHGEFLQHRCSRPDIRHSRQRSKRYRGEWVACPELSI